MNLDNNATTCPAPSVVAAVAGAMTDAWHNPSSVHRLGQDARRVIDLARQSVADLLGVKARTITFTSGGTEALDLAIRGSLRAVSSADPRRTALVTTRVEHAAIRSIAEEFERTGEREVRYLPIDAHGLVRTDAVASVLDQRAALVAVQWANNETGAVQPVQSIARACAAAGVRLLVDGTQWVGKMPVQLVTSLDRQGADHDEAGRLACDLLVCSPHKFHGPKGVGVLYARAGVAVKPTLLGTQETGRRGGTENVPGIAGAGEAARLAAQWLADPSDRARLETMRNRFEAAVLAACAGSRVNGRADAAGSRLWNTTNIAFPKLQAEAILLALSERGVAASAGAACSSGSLDPSPVLLAMGVAPEFAHGSVRFSICRDTTDAEIDAAVPIIVECIVRLRASMP